MNIAIIIPARYGSRRFPGKPLAKIREQTMLSRVVELAREGAKKHKNIDVMVTTEDQGIAAHAEEIGIPCIMTSEHCPSGSDRVLQAVQKCDKIYDFVINLQGDTPFTPPKILNDLIEEIKSAGEDVQVITPVHQMSWDELDALRKAKKDTPFSGTCTVIHPQTHQAIWFSKNIIPAIRKENRQEEKTSPVYQHIGIYAYRLAALEKFVDLPQGHYETLEGLEQLRLLENGIPVHTVAVDIPEGALQAGIDSPEDLARAEALLSG